VSTEIPTRTRAEIIRNAVDLFSKNGYQNTSLAEIAAAVGVQKPSLYHYIDSKEDLLYEINELLVEELLTGAQTLLASAETPEERLRAYLRATMRLTATRQKEVTIFLGERQFLKTQSKRWREVAERRDSYERLFESILEDGIATGVFTDVPVNIAALGILGTVANAYRWYRKSGPMTPDEIADLFADIVLHGISAPAQK
jgi:AcrR family transcriptional regulator